MGQHRTAQFTEIAQRATQVAFRISAPQWEYKTVLHTSPPPLPPGRSRQSSSTLPGGRGLPTLVEQLNREGADGWELADFITDAGPAHGLMVFKRIKQSPAE
jgi:hypothetical protein